MGAAGRTAAIANASERELIVVRDARKSFQRDVELAAECLDAVGEAAQSRAGDWIGASGAVVGDLDDELCRAGRRGRVVGWECLRMLVSASETR
jgi:hypothetical protein